MVKKFNRPGEIVQVNPSGTDKAYSNKQPLSEIKFGQGGDGTRNELARSMAANLLPPGTDFEFSWMKKQREKEFLLAILSRRNKTKWHYK
ncbi:MAG: hypothetical protein ACLFV2_10950 [Desulfurivibrionaceae bacterium]